MPRAWIEIAELLVQHLVELGEKFGDQPARAAMIGKEVVADTMAPWPPQRPVAVEAEEVAGALQVRPVAQFERRVEVPVRARLHEIDRMVIGGTTQEREEVRHPIRHAEAE